MPIFAGIVAALFSKIFVYLYAKFTINTAIILAAVATSIATIALLRVALAGIWSGVSLIAPPVVVNAFLLVMPGNLGTFISGIILVDVVRAAYDYWRQTERTAYLAKNYIT